MTTMLTGPREWTPIGKRWVRLIDLDVWEARIFGGPTVQVGEAPGLVRLASEQETGLFARKALPR